MTTSLRAPRHTVADWTQHHALGLDELDAHHRLLFELTNDLWHHLVRRSARNEVLATLSLLARCSLSHFATEETFMRVTAYPHMASHVAEHAVFIERIAHDTSVVMSGHPLSLDLLTFLKDWLGEHIRVADMDFARSAQAAHALPTSQPGISPPLSIWQRLLARF